MADLLGTCILGLIVILAFVFDPAFRKVDNGMLNKMFQRKKG